MPALFYQRFWHLVGNNVISCALAFLNRHELEPQLNYTHIVVILKCQTPELITQFRPICLSNVMFKIVSKAITNGLKPYMSTIISETQYAFVAN